MKELPIPCRKWEVRAILAGHKTQMRRVVNPQPSAELLADYANIRFERKLTKTDAKILSDCLPCPYGQPGDRLWVRETYFRDEEDGAILYAANPDDFDVVHHEKIVTGLPRYNWKPSTNMPRWASRITLEVTAVRVERLQDISEADAMAEGVVNQPSGWFSGAEGQSASSARAAYAVLWGSINGTGSWDANPFLRVIEFNRVTP